MNQSNAEESDDDSGLDETTCPLCVEEMDISDKNFLPCPCGYRVCMWCWHHIRKNLNGLCPACRTPYNEDPHAFSAVNADEIKAKNKERRMKEKQDKLNTPGGKVAGRTGSSQVVDRRLLHNYRVVQRNLVYVIGIPSNACSEETLRRPEYFGQYGKIVKIVIHKNHNANHASTISAYATFAHKEDARAAIQSLEGFWVDGHLLRASFGTTKYCNNFIRGVPCNNPDCVYLHELGDDDDRFTKEEIQQQAGHSKAPSVPGRDQQIVTGGGGPSGTGKRPTGDIVFPQPVFVQDLPGANKNPSRSSSLNANSDGQVPPNLDDMPGLPSQPNNSTSAGMRDMRAVVAGTVQENKAMYNANGGSGASRYTDAKQPAPSTAYSGNGTLPSSNVGADGVPRSPYTNTYPNTTASKDGFQQNLSETPSFNGIGKCAVFPVPISSLSISVWSTIRDVSSPDLMINPFNLVSLPISELLELTLPPVDASGITPWPKPLGHYTQNLGDKTAESLTASPAAFSTPPPPPPPPQLQQQQQQNLNRPPQANQQPPSNIAGLQQMFPGIKIQGVQK